MSQRGEGGAPRDDIGWWFAKPIPGKRHVVISKFCDKSITGGITRLKHHLAHRSGQIAPFQKVSPGFKKEMAADLKDFKTKKIDKKKRRKEL